VGSPEEWPWSSYGPALTGARSRVPLRDQALVAMFGEASEPARAAYREFVRAGIGLKKPAFLTAGRARTWADVMHAEEGSVSVDPDRPRRMTPDLQKSRVPLNCTGRA